MFADTVSFSYCGSSVTLTKINQDGYSSEYALKTSVYDMSMRIRHTKTKPTAGGTVYDRHNVELKSIVFATSTVPEFYRKAYFVIECKPNDGADGVLLMDALSAFYGAASPDSGAKLVNWES